jgi:hypothetical protein
VFFETDDVLEGTEGGGGGGAGGVEPGHGEDGGGGAAGGGFEGSGFESDGEDRAGGDEGDVGVALLDDDRVGGERRGGVEVFFAGLAETEVGRAGVGGEPLDGTAGLAGISGAEEAEVRERSEDGDVLNGVVGVAEIAVGEARADGDGGDGEIVLADVVAELFETAERGEVGDGVGEDVEAFGGEACGETCHILFRDACVEEAVGELGGEGFDDRVAEVADDEEDGWVEASLGGEFFDEGGSHDGFCSSWARALARRSALGAR